MAKLIIQRIIDTAPAIIQPGGLWPRLDQTFCQTTALKQSVGTMHWTILKNTINLSGLKYFLVGRAGLPC